MVETLAGTGPRRVVRRTNFVFWQPFQSARQFDGLHGGRGRGRWKTIGKSQSREVAVIALFRGFRRIDRSRGTARATIVVGCVGGRSTDALSASAAATTGRMRCCCGDRQRLSCTDRGGVFRRRNCAGLAGDGIVRPVGGIFGCGDSDDPRPRRLGSALRRTGFHTPQHARFHSLHHPRAMLRIAGAALFAISKRQ